jgi:leader peptidase (prepilin peptidase)/N-methyltransferase
MIFALLFIFGLLIGSFINVVALRYVDGQPLLGFRIIGGRSKCQGCTVSLKWYELVPLFSFLIQGAKCRHCKHSLNWQYPIVEFVTALLTAALPTYFFMSWGAAQAFALGQPMTWFYVMIGLWLLAAYTTITLSAIDVRLQIIPDQCNLLLGVIGLALTACKFFFIQHLLNGPNFVREYAEILGGPHNPFLSALIAVGFAMMLFGATIYFTKGRGMGMGDFKLAIPLALILGWPDILIALVSAFVIGSVIGLLVIANKKATMKSMVPFGPFLVIGLFVTVFYAESLLRWYFSLV